MRPVVVTKMGVLGFRFMDLCPRDYLDSRTDRQRMTARGIGGHVDIDSVSTTGLL